MPLKRPLSPVLRTLIVALIYLALSLVVEWIALARGPEYGSNIWYAPAGLALAYVLVEGVRFTPVTILSMFIGLMLYPDMHDHMLTAALISVLAGATYGTAATLLRHVIPVDLRLRRPVDVVLFLFTVIGVTFLAAALLTVFLVGAGYMSISSAVALLTNASLSVAAGCMIFTPLVLHYKDTLRCWIDGTPRSTAQPPWTRRKTIAALGQSAAAAALIVIALVTPPDLNLDPAMLLAVVLLWNAEVFGMSGVVIANAAVLGAFWIALQFNGPSSFDPVSLTALGIGLPSLGLFFGAAVDERQRGQRKLGESEANLLGLINNTNDLIWSVDRDFRLLSINTSTQICLKQMFDVVIEPGNSFILSVDPSQREFWQTHFERALRGERAIVERHITAHLKPSRVVEFSFSPLTLTDGSIGGVTVFGHDVSSHKQALAALRESEQQFRTLAELSPSAIYIVRPEHETRTLNVLYANSAAEQISGFSREQLNQLSRSMRMRPSYDDYVAIKALMDSQGASVSPTIEIPIMAGDGQEHWLSYRATPIDFEGKPAILATAYDITALKKAEAQLRASNSQLGQRNRELQALIEISRRLNATLDLREVFWTMFREVGETLLSSPHFAVILYDETANVLRPHFAIVDGEEIPADSLPVMPLGEGPNSETIRTGQPRIVDLEVERKELASQGRLIDIQSSVSNGSQVASALYVPLSVGDRALGVINVQHYQRNAYDAADLNLVTAIANQAAIAIENAQLVSDIREREMFFRSTFDQSAFGLAHLDLKLRIERVNQRLCDMTGYNPEELVGRPYLDLIFDADRSTSESRYQQVLDGTHSSAVLEKRMVHWDGSLIPVSVTLSPMRDADGQVLRLVTVVEDISRRKHAEESERKQRELAEALRQTAAIVNSTLELDEVLDHVLNSISRVVAHDLANVMLFNGSTCAVARSRGYELYNLQDWIEHQVFEIDSFSTFNWIMQHRCPLLIEDTRQYPGWVALEETAWILSHLEVPILSGGEVIGLIVLDSSVKGFFNNEDAERLQMFAEQVAAAIRNARLHQIARDRAARLELFAGIAAQTAGILDVDHLLEHSANLIADTFGYYAVEILLLEGNGMLLKATTNEAVSLEYLGKQVCLQGGCPAIGAAVSGTPVKIDDAGGYDLKCEFASHWSAGSLIAAPLKSHGEVFGVLVVSGEAPRALDQADFDTILTIADQLAVAIQNARLYDRIELHAAELEQRVAERTEELAAANEDLKRLSQVKDEFVSNVSHELRTPITSIKLYHRLLTMNPTKTGDYMQRLERETRRLEQIVEDLLQLSRMDQQRAPMVQNNLNLNEIVETLVADRTVLAKERAIKMTVRAWHENLMVYGDAAMLGQAISVLLTNALNYTPSGGRITVLTFPAGNTVAISVRDTGPGIPPEEHERLFERFYRGKAGRESGAYGTGLGLSIAREITERHMGHIEVESSGIPGKGAAFTIWLPLTTNEHSEDI